MRSGRDSLSGRLQRAKTLASFFAAVRRDPCSHGGIFRVVPRLCLITAIDLMESHFADPVHGSLMGN
jgi:hypothetical protein